MMGGFLKESYFKSKLVVMISCMHPTKLKEKQSLLFVFVILKMLINMSEKQDGFKFHAKE